MRDKALILIQWVVALGLLSYLVFSGKMQFTNSIVWLKDWPTLVFVMVLIVGQVFLSVLRWKFVLDGLGIQMSLSKLNHFTWIGQFFNNFLFGAVGGDAVRIYYVVSRSESKKKLAILSVFVDRLIGLYGLLFFAFIGVLIAPEKLLLRPEMKFLATIISVVTLGSFVCLLLLCLRLYPKFILKGRLLQLYEVMHDNSFKKMALVALGFSFITQLCVSLVVFAIASTIAGSNINFSEIVLLTPVGLFAMFLPISPAGIGVGQVSFSQLFEWAGIQSATLGADTITAFQIVGIAVNCLGIYSYLKFKKRGILSQAQAALKS